MMLKQMKFLAAAAALSLPAIVCAQQGSSQPSASAAQGDAAARVGDRVITIREVDEAWRKADPAEATQVTQRLYEGRRQALDRIIGDMLIEQAAKAKGVTPEQFANEE